MGRYMTLPDGTRFDLDEEIELSDGTWIRLGAATREQLADHGALMRQRRADQLIEAQPLLADRGDDAAHGRGHPWPISTSRRPVTTSTGRSCASPQRSAASRRDGLVAGVRAAPERGAVRPLLSRVELEAGRPAAHVGARATVSNLEIPDREPTRTGPCQGYGAPSSEQSSRPVDEDL